MGSTRTVGEESSTIESGTSRDTQCPECSGSLRWTGEEQYCADCGLVTDEDRLQRVNGGVQGDLRLRPTRNGSPNDRLRHDKGLGSNILSRTDANGNRIASAKQRRINRMRTHQHRSRYHGSRDRNLEYAIVESRRIGVAIGVAQGHLEQAVQLLKQIRENGLVEGRSLDDIAAAAILAICRINRLGRTIDQIGTVARVDEIRIQRTYRSLNTELGFPTPPPRPEEYIGSIASDLDLDREVRLDARDLLERLDEIDTCGKDPAGLAAAALYLVARGGDLRVTQERVGEAAGVSTVTLRKNNELLAEVWSR